LPELKEDIDKFQRQGMLDKRLSETYLQFDYDVAPHCPELRPYSLLPSSTCDTGTVCVAGQVYIGDILQPISVSRMTTGSKSPVPNVGPHGFKLARARLPVKTSREEWLADTEKNNITYVQASVRFTGWSPLPPTPM